MKIICCFIFLSFDFFSSKDNQNSIFHNQAPSQQVINITRLFNVARVEIRNHSLFNFSQKQNHLIINGFKIHIKLWHQ